MSARIRWRLVPFAWIAALLIPVATLPTPSHAAGQPHIGTAIHAETCMTAREYKRIHNGMRKRQVVRIVDSGGRLESRRGDVMTKSWRTCSGVPPRRFVVFEQVQRRWIVRGKA